MKMRNGFISNSSSSSFILLKKYLTEDQINAIVEYDEVDLIKDNGSESWHIKEEDDIIRGSTFMDNDILYNMIREMNPPMKAILEWIRDG